MASERLLADDALRTEVENLRRAGFRIMETTAAEFSKQSGE